MSRYYVGLDVHKASICIAVLDADGKLVMESVVETGAATILDFLKGLRGQVEVTFEEGTHAGTSTFSKNRKPAYGVSYQSDKQGQRGVP
jgi:precorrin-6B methylase 2